MLLVERGSRFASLCCGTCHASFRPGDRILVTYKQGQPRAIHAHSCVVARMAVAVPEQPVLARAA